MDKGDLIVDFFFIDDNVDEESSLLLDRFKIKNNKSAVTIHKAMKSRDNYYVCTDETHYWNEGLIWKVAAFKNKLIKHALENDYNYLFLIDSDIVLHPQTLLKLMENQKDIISTILWTSFLPSYPELPQVWLYDSYDLVPRKREEELNNEEKDQRRRQFLQSLRQPGIYEVGGLGACTLISRKALEKGVNFDPISNISFWGEDRHFCIRAVVLGLSLYVDTYYPAYHIYREADLLGLAAFKNSEVNKIIENVKKGIEGLGTFHYKHGHTSNWQSFFTDKMKSQLLSLIEKDYQKKVRQQLIMQLAVSNCSIEEYSNTNKVNFTIVKKTNLQGESFFEQCESFCIVLLNEKGDWLIDSLIVEDILE